MVLLNHVKGDKGGICHIILCKILTFQASSLVVWNKKFGIFFFGHPLSKKVRAVPKIVLRGWEATRNLSGGGVVLPQHLSGGRGSRRRPWTNYGYRNLSRGRGGFSKAIVRGEGWSEKICLPPPPWGQFLEQP